jgi:hypothetical protein
MDSRDRELIFTKLSRFARRESCRSLSLERYKGGGTGCLPRDEQKKKNKFGQSVNPSRYHFWVGFCSLKVGGWGWVGPGTWAPGSSPPPAFCALSPCPLPPPSLPSGGRA